MQMLPFILLVVCHQDEDIIAAASQAGCCLFSAAELSSHCFAVCYKFIETFASKSAYLIKLLSLNAYNNH